VQLSIVDPIVSPGVVGEDGDDLAITVNVPSFGKAK